MGLQICEDLWDQNYSIDLAQSIKDSNADMIINPQYVVTMNKTILTTTYKATVTGWAGNVTNVTK